MFLTKLTLPRRTFLRGMGTVLALPLLDAMVPALSALSKTRAKPVPRMGFIYVPNGASMAYWKPKGDGAVLELSPTLAPLAPFRDQVVVPTGLSQMQAQGFGDGNGEHTRGQAVWLSGVHIKRTEGADVENGTTVDQHAANHLGTDTPLRSLEIGLEPNYLVGNCDNGYSCVYLNTLAWRTPTTPMPAEANPRVVFERLFGSGATAAQRRAVLNVDHSILDSVNDEIRRLSATLGSSDRVKVSGYVDAIREVERRIQAQERGTSSLDGLPDRPIGIPESYDEHARLMLDLIALAFAADITRVFTLVLSREQSNRPYPHIGIPDAHHAISHHQHDPVKLEKCHKINTYHVSLLAHLAERLRGTASGDGNLLDQSMILHGSGISDGDRHDHNDLPLVIVGGGAGQLKGGRVLRSPVDTPMNNLLLAMLGKVGVAVDSFGDATGVLPLEPLTDL